MKLWPSVRIEEGRVKARIEEKKRITSTKGKERRFSLLEAQKPFHKQSKFRTQQIISLSRVG